MIFIVVKFTANPEDSYRWMDTVMPLTRGTRAEPGCKWYEWYHSVDEPNVFVVVEAFEDDAAAQAHMNAEHFIAGMAAIKPLLAKTPQIVMQPVDADGWGELDAARVD